MNYNKYICQKIIKLNQYSKILQFNENKGRLGEAAKKKVPPLVARPPILEPPRAYWPSVLV